MFGLGGQEILLLGLCCVVLPAGVAVFTFFVIRLQSIKRNRELEAENHELRRRLKEREGKT